MSESSHEQESVLLAPDHKQRPGAICDSLVTVVGAYSVGTLSTETLVPIETYLQCMGIGAVHMSYVISKR